MPSHWAHWRRRSHGSRPPERAPAACSAPWHGEPEESLWDLWERRCAHRTACISAVKRHELYERHLHNPGRPPTPDPRAPLTKRAFEARMKDWRQELGEVPPPHPSRRCHAWVWYRNGPHWRPENAWLTMAAPEYVHIEGEGPLQQPQDATAAGGGPRYVPVRLLNEGPQQPQEPTAAGGGPPQRPQPQEAVLRQ